MSESLQYPVAAGSPSEAAQIEETRTQPGAEK